MRRNYINLIGFIVLAVIFSGFAGCQSSSGNGTGNGNSEVAEAENPETSGKFPPLPGKIADHEIKMIDGTSFKLSEKKGKVILVNMWATWCGPCRAEMPELVAMHEKYKDKGFEVIGLDSDDSETVEMIRDFEKEMKLNYPLGFADAELFREFVRVSGLQGIPQSILINREGKMTGIFTGGGEAVVAKMKQTVEKTVNE